MSFLLSAAMAIASEGSVRSSSSNSNNNNSNSNNIGIEMENSDSSHHHQYHHRSLVDAEISEDKQNIFMIAFIVLGCMVFFLYLPVTLLVQSRKKQKKKDKRRLIKSIFHYLDPMVTTEDFTESGIDIRRSACGGFHVVFDDTESMVKGSNSKNGGGKNGKGHGGGGMGSSSSSEEEEMEPLVPPGGGGSGDTGNSSSSSPSMGGGGGGGGVQENVGHQLNDSTVGGNLQFLKIYTDPKTGSGPPVVSYMSYTDTTMPQGLEYEPPMTEEEKKESEVDGLMRDYSNVPASIMFQQGPLSVRV